MFRFHSPGAIFFSLIAAGFLSLFKPSRKIRKSASGSEYTPYINAVQKVVASHADCAAEVFNVFISGAGKVRIFSRLTPGDMVELRLRDDDVAVYAGGKYMSTPILPASSRLRNLLETNTEVEAFLGGRDVAYSTDEAEFCSIIAFYKIKGVPPTHVSVQ